MLSKLNSVADRVLSALVPRREAGACGPVCYDSGYICFSPVDGSGGEWILCHDPCHQVPTYAYCSG